MLHVQVVLCRNCTLVCVIRNRILLEILIFVELGFELVLGHQCVLHQLYLKLLVVVAGAKA